MKIATSYFYQIRNFKPNMIPFSTAKWDPTWYHANTRDESYVFRDKRGIYNGIRLPMFAPWNSDCQKDCKQKPGTCTFIKAYEKQLNFLKPDLVVADMLDTCSMIQNYEKFKEEPVAVLIVYETPDNLCSERKTIQDWFTKNGYPCKELQID